MQQITLTFRSPRVYRPSRCKHWHDMTREEKHRETIRLVCAPTRVRKVPVSLPRLSFLERSSCLDKEEI